MQRCQKETTSTEFLEWQTYFHQERNQPRREEFYLAQIALEIRRILAKHPLRLKLDNFILRFSGGKTTKLPTGEELTDRISKSKQAWFAFTDANSERPQVQTPPTKP